MSKKTNNVEELSEASEANFQPTEAAPATMEVKEEETTSISSEFINVQKSKKKDVPVVKEVKPEKEKTEVVNNIKLDVKEHVIDAIAPGTTLQANFKSLELVIRAEVQEGDKPADALNKLREAIFAVRKSKKLPDGCGYQSAIGRTPGQLVAVLDRAIAPTGEIDAVIEIF